MNFWEKVDEELKFKNISRKELARLAEFNVVNISKGIRANNIPAADTAVKIAEVLGVTVEYLVAGKNPQFSQDFLNQEMQLFQKYRPMIQKLEKLSLSAQEGIELLLEKLTEK